MATLYKTCPKCGAAAAGFDTCAACGLIFAKYLKARFAAPQSEPRPASAQLDDEDSLLSRAEELLFSRPEEGRARLRRRPGRSFWPRSPSTG